MFAENKKKGWFTSFTFHGNEKTLQNTCYRICHIYPAALLLRGRGWGCEFGSAVVNCFSTVEAVVYLYNLTRTTLQCCILAIACDRSPRFWGKMSIIISGGQTLHTFNAIHWFIWEGIYQTGRWSWVPGYSSLWLPTGNLNVSGYVHRRLVHLACSPSYYSWYLSHPATQGSLGKGQKTHHFVWSNLCFEFCYSRQILPTIISLQILRQVRSQYLFFW